MEKATLHQIGVFLDRVMTLNVHFKYLKGDVVGSIYRECKELLSLGEEPLSVFTAQDIVSRLKAHDRFLMITGWRNVPKAPYGEMDGPPGAAVLARAINRACKATPIFVVEKELNEVITDACRIVGMSVLDVDEAIEAGNACAIVNYPIEESRNDEIISEILGRIDPSYAITIERPGMNENGEYHTRWGSNVSKGVAKIDYLFEEAKKRKIRTLAIGDAGNDLGMNRIKKRLLELFPEGRKCKCQCGGSIASAVEADVTFIATVCNWGGYAIAAALAAVKEDTAILHDGETERRVLISCAENGAVDTSIWAPRPTPEALSTGFHCSLVELMREVTERGILGTSGL